MYNQASTPQHGTVSGERAYGIITAAFATANFAHDVPEKLIPIRMAQGASGTAREFQKSSHLLAEIGKQEQDDVILKSAYCHAFLNSPAHDAASPFLFCISRLRNNP